jgi:uncharacterized membrane protein
MTAATNPAQAVPAPRIQSVDALRGAIMMVMAIDHIRDFVARSAQQFLPTDLTRTTPAIFFTRWITHFCAPVFVLTAGLGAYLWVTRGHHAKSDLSRLLMSRGIWLIVLEVTILRFIMFSQISFTANPVLLIILWAIGMSMIALAGLIYLPKRVLVAVSIAIIGLHNLLQDVPAERFGHVAWMWDILYSRGVIAVAGITFRPAYPVLPWIGVMAGGYCLGTVFDWDADRRRRFLVRLGLALTVAFVVVRAMNGYGDPAPWSHRASPVYTMLSFLNVTKYPPSLDFLLMTLGPAMVALALLDTVRFPFTNPLVVFGRVPFFFYVAHMLLAHAMAIGMNFVRYGAQSFLLIPPPSMGSPSTLFPADYGYPLWAVYAVWAVVLVLLYPACLWFARLKQRRHDWWLTYL